MYNTMFEDFVNDLFKINKDSFRFNSPVGRVYETYSLGDNTVLLTLNLLGVRPEDIEVDVKNGTHGLQILSVSASTENKIIKKKYSYSNEFTVGSTRRELDSFEWESKDGILYIVLKYKELSKLEDIKSKRKIGLLEDLHKKLDLDLDKEVKKLNNKKKS